MWSGGREIAEVDEEYLLQCESEHAARTPSATRPSVGQDQVGCQSGTSNGGRRLQRKALLSVVTKWKTEGVPVDLLRGD